MPSDIDELNKASFYMVLAPIVTTAIFYGYNKLRESGGASSHLAHAISKAKSRFTPADLDRTGGMWPSKRPSEDTLANRDI